MPEPIRMKAVGQALWAHLGIGEEPDDLTEVERLAVAAVGRNAALSLQDAGLAPRPRQALDMTLREMVGIAAAYSDLRRWWPQPGLEDRRLSDVLKVVPPRVAENVRFWLNWCGHLDDPDARLHLTFEDCGEDDP